MTLLSRLKTIFRLPQYVPQPAAVSPARFSESEAAFFSGVRSMTTTERDRMDFDRGEILEQALAAWRLNPLARRIVELTSQYVVGGGISVTVKHERTARFVNQFWHHRYNAMPVRVYEWCDELTRSGNLFILLSTDASGMSYVRAVPAQDIERIESLPNDIEQPVRFYPKASLENPDPAPYTAYNPTFDAPKDDGSFPPVMIHYAVNRPAGAQWGESDLAPVLKWLSRYANWLEDRARLNRFRTAFLYVVKGKFLNDAERAARQQSLNAFPPTPGSILVCDESETWDIISAKLDSGDAATDGLALKKMIAAGIGVPLHFLAEPESSTRTTAEAAGGPTFRHYEQRQNYFTWLLQDVLRIVVTRKALLTRGIPIPGSSASADPLAEIIVQGADISARDNLSLSMAASNVAGFLFTLRDRRLIDDTELLRLLYRFAGETSDTGEILKQAQSAPPPILPPSAGAPPKARKTDIPIDPFTGEET